MNNTGRLIVITVGCLFILVLAFAGMKVRELMKGDGGGSPVAVAESSPQPPTPAATTAATAPPTMAPEAVMATGVVIPETPRMAPTPSAAPASSLAYGPAPAAVASRQVAEVSEAPSPRARLDPVRERRIERLLANAMARDVTGESERAADRARATRAACRNQACIDRSYAAQEANLRQWDGAQ